MATKSKKTTSKKPAAKKINGSSKSKTAQVAALLNRASGVTRKEVLALTNWKAVSMQQLAASAGVKLKIDDSERPYRYRAA